MPHADIKAELHWHSTEVKPGKLCAGCKFEIADEGVLVSMVVPGLDPVRPKTFCNGCFETMFGYWERNQLIQPLEVASTGKPRRIDSEGRDVTDLPGLWSESDKIGNL